MGCSNISSGIRKMIDLFCKYLTACVIIVCIYCLTEDEQVENNLGSRYWDIVAVSELLVMVSNLSSI